MNGMNKIKIIALFGKSCSGKDTIQKFLINTILNSHGIVSCTTRPKRDYEINAKDYFFLSKTEFLQRLLDGDMLEATEFNNWHYGTSLQSLKENAINIGVFNIEGIEHLLENNNIIVLPIYVKCSNKIRLMRSLTREEDPDCAEICRRFQTDEKDFLDIPFNYLTCVNEKPTDKWPGLLRPDI